MGAGWTARVPVTRFIPIQPTARKLPCLVTPRSTIASRGRFVNSLPSAQCAEGFNPRDPNSCRRICGRTAPLAGDTGRHRFQKMPFVLHRTSGLPLQPLIFWNHCIHHPELDGGHCYLFDRVESPGVFSFKAAGATCTCTASIDNELAPLAVQLIEFCKADPTVALLDVGELRDNEEQVGIGALV
jgi:hypothetical protein